MEGLQNVTFCELYMCRVDGGFTKCEDLISVCVYVCESVC